MGACNSCCHGCRCCKCDCSGCRCSECCAARCCLEIEPDDVEEVDQPHLPGFIVNLLSNTVDVDVKKKLFATLKKETDFWKLTKKDVTALKDVPYSQAVAIIAEQAALTVGQWNYLPEVPAKVAAVLLGENKSPSESDKAAVDKFVTDEFVHEILKIVPTRDRPFKVWLKLIKYIKPDASKNQSFRDSFIECGVSCIQTRSGTVQYLSVLEGLVEEHGDASKQAFASHRKVATLFNKLGHLALLKPDLAHDSVAAWLNALCLVASDKSHHGKDALTNQYIRDLFIDIVKTEGEVIDSDEALLDNMLAFLLILLDEKDPMRCAAATGIYADIDFRDDFVIPLAKDEIKSEKTAGKLLAVVEVIVASKSYVKDAWRKEEDLQRSLQKIQEKYAPKQERFAELVLSLKPPPPKPVNLDGAFGGRPSSGHRGPGSNIENFNRN